MRHSIHSALARVLLLALFLTTPPLVVAQTATQFAESVIADMTKPDDGVQIGYQRDRYARTQMGLMARGDYTPNWWKPYDKSLKSTTWWTAIVPWWNVLPLQGNAASRTRVEIGTVAAIARNRSTGAWYTISRGPSSWAANYNASSSAYVGPANVINGSISGYPTKLYLPPSGSNTVHGGGGGGSINAQSIDGLVICLAARLVGSDASAAKYAMWMGSDWYPYASFNVAKQTAPYGWIPSIGTGRMKKITTAWQSFCFAPLDNPGRAGVDSWYKNAVGVLMSTSQFRARPPAPIGGLLPR